MAKRKADIFIVAEYVVNWFEASKHNTVPTEIPEGAGNRSELGGTKTGKPNVAGSSANKDEADQQGLILSQSTGEAANRPKVTPDGEGSAGTTSPSGNSDVGKPRPPATTELAGAEAATHHAFWALLKEAGYEEW